MRKPRATVAYQSTSGFIFQDRSNFGLTPLALPEAVVLNGAVLPASVGPVGLKRLANPKGVKSPYSVLFWVYL